MAVKKKVKKLYLSDLHLGSHFCRTKKIWRILNEYDYEELVIVGDLCEKGAKLQGDQIEIVKYLYENQNKIICTDGNHDLIEDGVVAKMLGIEVCQEYEFEFAGKKFLVLHGHRFHKICCIFSEPLIDKIFAHTVDFLKKRHICGYRLENWINRLHAGISRRFAKKIAKYAYKKGKDVIICGHIHDGIHLVFKHKGKTIHYWNCGHWTGDDCSYLTMDEDGTIHLHAVEDEEK